MRGVRGSVAAVIVLLAFGPPAAAAAGTIVFERPSRVDRPGRGSAQARQNTPQVAELSSGPLVLWEDDRDVRLRHVGAVRRGERWTEVDPKLGGFATTFASDGGGTAWALADSADGVTTRSTRNGRTWEPGPRVFGRHRSWHAIAATGHRGRLLVVRAALDVQNCGRVGRLENIPTAAARGDETGLHVGEIVRGRIGRDAALLDPSARYVDVDSAISPSGVGWVAAATLHGIAVYRERSVGGWEAVQVPAVVPPASIQRVRVAPTQSEVVVIWQLLRGRDREVVSRAYRLASRTWGEPRVLGPHDGQPSLDATVAPASEGGDESSVVAVWVSANEVAVAERHRRRWHGLPQGGGGLPDAVSVATIKGRATIAYAARRVDGSTTAEHAAPNTDVFVRTQEGEGHWAPGERVDRDAHLTKRPGSPRVWTSDREAYVAFDDDGYAAGRTVVSKRLGAGWSDAEGLAVDGEPAEIALVAPDGSRVLRVDDTFVFQDSSGDTVAKVDGIGRENEVVATGAGRFVVASIVGDPGRGEEQRFELREVGAGRDRAATLAIPHDVGLDLYADGKGGTHVLTTRYNRDSETFRIGVRDMRDGRIGPPRTIAADAPPGHAVTADGAGGLIVATRQDDGIVLVRSDDVPRVLSLSRPGSQFQVDAAGEHTVVLASAVRARRLVVARSDGGPLTVLPPLPGRFEKITGLGFGYSTASLSYGPPSCFTFRNARPRHSGMTGWQTFVHTTEDGRITIAARHRADVLVAQLEPGADDWSYGETGTRSKSATGDVTIDRGGDAVVAWLDVDGQTHRVFASSVVGASSGGRGAAIAAALGSLVVLALAAVLRRRAA